ncbi:MAG: HAD family hydrolase [Lachnospiraceae bacterium]|nr:HAD family hydrolase [Lachnospiraceae bacterium]
MKRRQHMEAVIFDVDGTLWDAADSMAYGWTNVMNERFDPDFFVDGNMIRPILGRTPVELAGDLMPTIPAEKAEDIFHILAEGELPYIREASPDVYDGFRTVLPKLAEKYKLFIVSNCDAGYIEMFLEVTGLGDLFEGHLCPGDTGEGKAENIRTVMEEYGISEAVYVGDTDKDSRECAKAGVPFIYASYGYGKTDSYTARIGSPLELPEVLDEM